MEIYGNRFWAICKPDNSIQLPTPTVKGHTTDGDIGKGIATKEDKFGSSIADFAADEGCCMCYPLPLRLHLVNAIIAPSDHWVHRVSSVLPYVLAVLVRACLTECRFALLHCIQLIAIYCTHPSHHNTILAIISVRGTTSSPH